MTDLPRLKIASNQPVCRMLLESALEDHSAPGAAERALAALNLGVGAAATVAAVHAGTSANVGSHVAGGMVLKWLGLGLLVGTATLVSAEQALRVVSERRATPAASAPRNIQSAARQKKVEAVTPAAPHVPESAPPLPVAPAPPHVEALAWRAADSLPEVRAGESAAEPLSELRAIRRALAEHAPDRALLLLEAFVTRHPASTLLEEAAVLRFDALSALGSSQALAEGRAFLNRYPRSAYAERVRIKLVGLR